MGFENGKLLRVTMSAVKGNDSQVNTFHYDCDDHSIVGTGENDPQALADFFRDNVFTPFKALYDSSWTIQPVVVVNEKDPQNPTGARSEWTSGAAVAGTKSLSGDLLPTGICAVVKLVGQHLGRRFNGRIFVGGAWTEDNQHSGIWEAGGTTTLINNYVNAIPHQPDIASGVSAATCDWCVYSRTQRSQDLDPYASHVQSTILRTQLHYLRSRAQY